MTVDKLDTGTKDLWPWETVRSIVKQYAALKKLTISYEDIVEQLEKLALPEFEEVTLSNSSRRWEVLSAMQKSIRRGETIECLRMVSALVNTEDHDFHQHMWRRLAVTAVEDIGPANLHLVALTLLLSQGFSTKKWVRYQRMLCYRLAVLLCESVKNRLFCDYAIIDALESKLTGDLSDETKNVVHVVREWKLFFEGMDGIKFDNWMASDSLNEEQKFVFKENFRTEGLGKWVVCSHPPHGLVAHTLNLCDTQRIKGIKEYAYDMHTRLGKRMLVYLTGFGRVKKLLEQTIDSPRALGWALFFAEGGKLDREQICVGSKDVYDAAVEVAMNSCGLDRDSGLQLISKVEDALYKEIRGVREKFVNKEYQ